jgi:hypothetical protein
VERLRGGFEGELFSMYVEGLCQKQQGLSYPYGEKRQCGEQDRVFSLNIANLEALLLSLKEGTQLSLTPQG